MDNLLAEQIFFDAALANDRAVLEQTSVYYIADEAMPPLDLEGLFLNA